MLRSCDLVFDDVVQGTTSVYTDPKWNGPMSVADACSLIAVASQSTSGSTLTVEGETSGDGVNWVGIGFGNSTIINALSLSDTDKTFGGSTGYFANGMRLVRLKVTLGGTNPSSRVQLWWVGRDFAL